MNGGQPQQPHHQPPPPLSPPQQPPLSPPQQPPQPHVLLLPLPLQGPINCFLKLAELLSLSSTSSDAINVTFLNAVFVHRRLSDLPSRFSRYSNFRFSLLSDGISGDNPRTPGEFPAMVAAFEAEAIRRLPEFAAESPAVTCLIADGVLISAGEAAMRLGIPVVYFSTLAPCCIWINSCLIPGLVDSGQVPFKEGDDLDEPVINIPGTETCVRRRDLPSICRDQDMKKPYVQLLLKECRELPNAQGHILNTFDDLEGPLLPHLSSICTNLYTIGPLHVHWKARLQLEPEPWTPSSNSLWQEDRTCIAWLDAQPSKSVVFVSIGSVAVMTNEQFMEFWYGLVNSGVRFLLVRRPGLVSGMEGDDEDPLKVSSNERGFVVSWAPQEEVLSHQAIGGFLTHSGWNSTLESIVEGVPMLCWPLGIDQLVISRFVGEVWKIGIDMKDMCDRVVIEDMVRELMARRDEFLQQANVLSKLAGEAVKKDGSSWCGLDRLIEDIKFMRLQVPRNA